jgi:hypothetical protein
MKWLIHTNHFIELSTKTDLWEVRLEFVFDNAHSTHSTLRSPPRSKNLLQTLVIVLLFVFFPYQSFEYISFVFSLTHTSRFFSFCLFLSQDLLKHTEETHPDFTLLSQTLVTMKKVANDINESIKEYQNYLKILEIQSKFMNCPPVRLIK